MGGGSSQTTRDPLRNQKRLAADALNLYVLGPGAVDPNTLGSPQVASDGSTPPTDLSATFGGSLGGSFSSPFIENGFTGSPTGGIAAGELPGTIFPSFSGLQDLASQNFLSQLSGENVDPTLSQALGMITNPTAAGFGGGSGGFGSNFSLDLGSSLNLDDFPTIVDPEIAQQAVSDLANQPSLFDQLSGGPIVDEISNRTNTLQDSLQERSATNLRNALDIGRANLDGTLISSSRALQQDAAITERHLQELAVTQAGVGLESAKFTTELALQDLQLGTRRLESIIQAALVEQGANKDFAAAQAKILADSKAQVAVAEINSQTQLALGQQQSGLGLLGLLQQDFRDTQQAQTSTELLPFDLTAQVLGAGSSPTGQQSSKDI